MNGNFVVFAPNIGGGGGLVLLRELLHAIPPDIQVTAILDQRGQQAIGPLDGHIDVKWFKSNVVGRWRAEKLLSRLTRPQDQVLCFHNLPPILPTAGKVICYVQNAYLVGAISRSNLNRWPRFRTSIEEVIARCFRHKVDRYVVQTTTMAESLRKWFGKGVPQIDILPFSASANLPTSNGDRGKFRTKLSLGEDAQTWDFVYISDGPAHKNHARLFAAWSLLSERGIYPSLALTLHPERDRDLRSELDRQIVKYDLRITDLGPLTHTEALALYLNANALIFPSYAESFGVPLLEAMAAGIPILASELDYVRDVCDPVVTFDPFSSRSIARAVLRFQGYGSDRTVPMSARAVIGALTGTDRVDCA